MSLKKKAISFVLIGSTVFSMITSTALAGNIGITSDNNINVRSSASIDSAILTKLSTGQSINIVSAEGDWYKFKQDNGNDAYIAKQFVKLIEADGVVSDDSINIRALPNTDSQIVTQVSTGTLLPVYGSSGDFYNVDLNGTKAYIHKDFLLGDLLKTIGQAPEVVATSAQVAESVYVLVTSGTGINLRSEPSESSEIMFVLSSNTGLDLIEKGEQWHKVSYSGKIGYVSAEFTSINKGIKPENSKAQEIIDYAKQFLGTPYVWSGTNLRSGVDCSGFTYAVMRDSGINVNRSSRGQINNGTNISKSELKMGDLVFFDTTNSTNQGYISHVGIYMSNGQFIHSSSSRKSNCVTISSLSEDYYTMRYIGATRVIN